MRDAWWNLPPATSTAPRLGHLAVGGGIERGTGRQRSREGWGTRAGATSQERERIAELEKENRELRKANQILKEASVFFAQELDRPADDPPYRGASRSFLCRAHLPGAGGSYSRGTSSNGLLSP